MSRKTLWLALPAVLAAGSISIGILGSPVGSADAASPGRVTKAQLNAVKLTAKQALKKSNANGKAISRLSGIGVATAGTPGPQGPAGPAGGFDPSTVTRVAGTPVAVSNAVDYTLFTTHCPAGSIALSGGWLLGSGDEKKLTVARSYPATGLTAWTLRVAYTGADAPELTPYVVCAA